MNNKLRLIRRTNNPTVIMNKPSELINNIIQVKEIIKPFDIMNSGPYEFKIFIDNHKYGHSVNMIKLINKIADICIYFISKLFPDF